MTTTSPIKTVEELLENLSSQVILADFSDGDGMRSLMLLANDLSSALDPAIHAESRHRLATCQALFLDIAMGDSSDPATDLEKATALVADVQRLVRQDGAPAVDAPQSVGEESAASATSPPIPDWVDPAIFKDFLAAQKVGLEDLEAEILGLEKGNGESLALLRRRIHTLKGEAGVVGLDEVAHVCHAVEDLLEVSTAAESVDAILEVKDWLVGAIEAYGASRKPAVEGGVLARRLERLAASQSPAKPVDRDPETVSLFGDFLQDGHEGMTEADEILLNVEQEGATTERINGLFRVFHSFKGIAGILSLTDISSLAHSTETLMNKVRQGEFALQGPVLDLIFDSTAVMRRMLGEVRRAVEAGEEVRPNPDAESLLTRLREACEGRFDAPKATPAAAPEERLGEILQKPPTSVPEPVIEAAVETQKVSGRKLGNELVQSGGVEAGKVGLGLRAQKQAAESTGARIREMVKVDLERVDTLVELVGELAVIESMVIHAPELETSTSPTLRHSLSQLSKISRDLQSVGLRMRMMPVSGVFQKMARLVRDLSAKSGKSVRLMTSGENTEMDRSMVEQIHDPLVHMIRNSMDHGLEMPDVREAAGKPAQGTLTLSAYHEGGHIVIDIRDDGRGLDRVAILAKARSQGLVKEDETPSDGEIDNLIFLPGFSTAKKVTEISGRGVGMDVVRRNIDAMRGRIAVRSTPGEGTEIKILLPLTLAIIDGMLVSCGQERYIVPTLSIVESIQPTAEMLSSFAGRHELINMRGETLPLLRLDRLFGVEGAKQDPTQCLVMVVESMGTKIGLLTDDVVMRQQVVIKNLDGKLKDSRYLSGAAILSDGRVGLILNVDELRAMADRNAEEARNTIAV